MAYAHPGSAPPSIFSVEEEIRFGASSSLRYAYLQKLVSRLVSLLIVSKCAGVGVTAKLLGSIRPIFRFGGGPVN